MKPAHLFTAGLLASFGLLAGAQMPMPQPGVGAAPITREAQGRGDPAKMQERMARMRERMARHMAEFKQKLQLSPGQEAAWNNFMAALNPANPNAHRIDRAELAKLPTPERNDRMRAQRAERNAEMDKRADATKTFYASLTPEQKKAFDAETVKRGRHGPGGHRGRHHNS
jgi:periplasmic protein CpxP/Spy